ncbi:MAG: hypothetical protein DPW11_03225, partial [bacterium]|nr:hypothetical protein [bacterium]
MGLFDKVKSMFGHELSESESTSIPTAKLREVDVVFVIDATGSMASQIAEVKTRLKEFAKKLANSEVRPSVAYGVVAYRDHPPEDNTFVTYPVPLSENVEKVLKGIDSLELLQNKGIEQVSPSPTRELGGGGRSPLLNARI